MRKLFKNFVGGLLEALALEALCEAMAKTTAALIVFAGELPKRRVGELDKRCCQRYAES
jgi:hypothetical protein